MATSGDASDSKARPPPDPPLPVFSYSLINPRAKRLYLKSSYEANVHLASLPEGPLGFDLEWKPVYSKGVPPNPVALVQLANHDTIFLIQLTAMRVVPAQLKALLANPKYLKIGVGIQGDIMKLTSDWDIDEVRGLVDLSLLARTVDNARWKGKYTQSIGLARLVAVYEQRKLQKGKITRSNWEAHLSPAQQEYASNDAYAGYSLYVRLLSVASHMAERAFPAFYSFDYWNGYFRQPESRFLWVAQNPFYDPGPPPPPREPKVSAKKESKAKRAGPNEKEPLSRSAGNSIAVPAPQVTLSPLTSLSIGLPVVKIEPAKAGRRKRYRGKSAKRVNI